MLGQEKLLVSDNKFAFSNCQKYTVLWAGKICWATCFHIHSPCCKKIDFPDSASKRWVGPWSCTYFLACTLWHIFKHTTNLPRILNDQNQTCLIWKSAVKRRLGLICTKPVLLPCLLDQLQGKLPKTRGWLKQRAKLLGNTELIS